MKEFDFTEFTFAPEWVLDRSVITKKHVQFYAENCRKLAAYMKKVPIAKHNQARWANDRVYEDNCGTPACALGHAAYSNEFPGLQFGINGTDGYTQVIAPVINGGYVMGPGCLEVEPDWERAGEHFFGQYAVDTVFNDSSLTKSEVVFLLLEAAEHYDRAGHDRTPDWSW